MPTIFNNIVYDRDMAPIDCESTFKSWTTYMEAFTCYLSDKSYGRIYPVYASLPTSRVGNRDIAIVENLVKSGQDPNIGLIKLLYVVIIEPDIKFAHDYFSIICEMIDRMLIAGAKMPTDILFEPVYDKRIWETNPSLELVGYSVRAMLIDRYGTLSKIHECVDWFPIRCESWFDGLMEGPLTEEERLAHLKYYSEYLRVV